VTEGPTARGARLRRIDNRGKKLYFVDNTAGEVRNVTYAMGIDLYLCSP
jgi:hypothetical protein